MIPRKQIDISARDLGYGLLSGGGLTAAPATTDQAGRPTLDLGPDALTCLSVRSGFDLLLGELQWPEGTEVLVSAITIPDMIRILRHHGLRPVPIDLDPATLAPDEEAMTRAITSRTRAILVAHLFGSLSPTGGLVKLARTHNLQLWEDCAQAFAADGFTGNPDSDVCFFSFGAIKTATALGGGVLLVREDGLRKRLRERQQQWPRQSSWFYCGKLLKFTLFKPLQQPVIYGICFGVLRTLGCDPDSLITRLARGFTGPDFFHQIRHQPCPALRRMIRRRLSTYDPISIQKRRDQGERLRDSLAENQLLGMQAQRRTHWLFPMLTARRNELQQALQKAGFDATSAPSSLFALPPESGGSAPVASAAMEHVLYVPVPGNLSTERRSDLARVIASFIDPPAIRRTE